MEDEDCALESELVGGDTRLTVTGVSAHASVPEKGKNAAKMLVHVLAKLGIGGAPIALLDEAAGRESAGEDLGIAGSDKVSGALTINLGLLFAKAGKIDVTFDCRYPVFFNPETIGETVQRRLAPAGYTLDPIHPSTPQSPYFSTVWRIFSAFSFTQSARSWSNVNSSTRTPPAISASTTPSSFSVGTWRRIATSFAALIRVSAS